VVVPNARVECQVKSATCGGFEAPCPSAQFFQPVNGAPHFVVAPSRVWRTASALRLTEDGSTEMARQARICWSMLSLS
jgi:hypothetical protein